MKEYTVVLRLVPFAVEAVNSRIPVSVSAGPMVGYLPVYETREDAEREYPDGPFMRLRQVEQEESLT